MKDRVLIRVIVTICAVSLAGGASWWYVGNVLLPAFPSVLSEHAEAPSIERMKREGCVADGMLSGYGGDTKRMIQMVNHSECYYFHRALETWLAPPDFAMAARIKRQVGRPDAVYGMFLAEAIDTKASYPYPAENRLFDFKSMCAPGTEDRWGKGTCIPSLARDEYRKYLRYVTSCAMDIGIQSFLFGQSTLQDGGDAAAVQATIADLRREASSRGMRIVIGGQTGANTDAAYLRSFDYIEGGVGIDSRGNIEGGACLSKYMDAELPWCWGLLWNPVYAGKAKNVLLNLDWNGTIGDDMNTFAKMSGGRRALTLSALYGKFTAKGMGFLLPLTATLDPKNGGCVGPNRNFYSANRDYSCRDEDVIKEIIRSGRTVSDDNQ